MGDSLLRPLAALFLLSAPLWAQFAGPAILSRGEAPTTIDRAQITFRPFVEARASYDTALSGVAVTPAGEIAHTSSLGTGLVWGVSGAHSWRHTFAGVQYRGSINHYARQTYYDNVDQSLLFSVVHQFSPHVTLSLSESIGSYSRDFGLGGLAQTIAFDPATTSVPTTDFFDNRTTYYATQANLIYNRTRRLSFAMSGSFSIVGRRSAALLGSMAEMAMGDVQYRLTRRSTIGAAYEYTHFDFGHAVASTDAHTVIGSFSLALSRRSEFSIYGGVSRVETKYIRTEPVDPVIGALLGITGAQQIVHSLGNISTAGARISRAFFRGVAYANSGYRITPGNGLFLTSYSIYSNAGYNLTRGRHWSFGAYVSYDRSESVANYQGDYSTAAASFRAARSLGRLMHFAATYSLRRYDSPTFSGYQRLVQQAGVGIAFAPGDVPLRMW